MIKLTEQQINEIASELDAGMRCFYNKQTGEVKTIPDFDSWFGADQEPWEEDLTELDENRINYIEFEDMSSRESFKIMANFTESVEDVQLRDRLIDSLNRSKPFRNFKRIIDNSGDYREKWFEFKEAKYIEWVKGQIKQLNRFENNG